MSYAILDAKGRSLGLSVRSIEDIPAAFARNPRAEIARDEKGVVVARRPHTKRLGPSPNQVSLFGHIPTKAPLK